jgi:hypothetical protein
MNYRLFCFLGIFLSFTLVLAAAPGKLTFDKYHQPKELNTLLKSWTSEYPQLTKLINIGKSSGKNNLFILRIAAEKKGSSEPDSRPAIFVSANLEGVHLVGTEAALMLIEKLLTKYGSDEKITGLLEKRTVYVAPLLNPDAAQYYFADISYERRTNARSIDEDLDDLIDEDGFDDLNKDGLITQMRVKDPDGKWIPDPAEPRLMRRADPNKGEKGIYKIYTEGLDNDGDGEYNEDPPGGVELNRNFPHDFEYDIKAAGRWPVSEKESIALVKFLVSKPNIAMVLNFSSENTLLNLQQTGKVRAPEVQARAPRQRRRLEPAMNIDSQDMPFMKAVQKDYKNALNKEKLNYPENKAKGVGKGSFVAYCYYQYGVQIFSSDLWAIPESQKGLPRGTGHTAPTRTDARMEKMPMRSPPMEGLKEGPRGGEHPDLYILKWSDSVLRGKGFVTWTPYKHPTLGDVEIGGFIPYIKTTPPPSEIEKTISFHADFYIDLMNRLPELKTKDTQVKALEDGLYQVTVSFTNIGRFPTSTAQGRRARTSWPIKVHLKMTENQSLFSGRSIESIPVINENGDIKKLEWTIRGKKSSKITITAKSPKLGSVTTTVVLQ